MEWQEHCATSEKLVALLKERLEASRRDLYDQDTLNQDMQSELHNTTEQLKVTRMEREQDLEKMDQV